MRVALLYPGWTKAYGRLEKLAHRVACWPPLNLAYLAAYAEQAGHQACIIDGQAEQLSTEQMVARVKDWGADLIGITATTPFFHIATELAKSIKAAGIAAPIAIGGPHVSVARGQSLPPCYDYRFIGEADGAWKQFLGGYADIPDVNQIPMPARHLLKNELYRIGTLRGTRRFTSIMTVRGCPFHCIFCSTRVFGKDIRRRSPALVIEEMRLCVDRFGTEHFMFLDDTLTLNRPHIMEICERIIAAKLNVTFEGSTRANLVDEAMVAKMAEAGLIRISFGLESADEGIRRTMKKMVPLESYEYANRLTNKYGIETLNSCMIGLPGETRDTVKKTLAFLRKSKEIKQANISIAVPYPGTELYDMAKAGKHGLELMTEDFSQYRRYDAAVMKVGELRPAELVSLQNQAFVSIYLAPWRWWPMFRKQGIAGVWMTLKRLFRCLWNGDTEYLTNRGLGL